MGGIDRPTLHGFVGERTAEGATVYTDELRSYRRMPGVKHQTVRHSAGEYIRGEAHTNGIESHWALLKRGIIGTYHQVSEKHVSRYVAEFSGRHNDRPSDTIDQVRHLVKGMSGKRLRYRYLIA